MLFGSYFSSFRRMRLILEDFCLKRRRSVPICPICTDQLRRQGSDVYIASLAGSLELTSRQHLFLWVRSVVGLIPLRAVTEFFLGILCNGGCAKATVWWLLTVVLHVDGKIEAWTLGRLVRQLFDVEMILPSDSEVILISFVLVLYLFWFCNGLILLVPFGVQLL